jgi:hypothetical protein
MRTIQTWGDTGKAGQRILLLQLDGKLPNLALMRIGAHHRARGDSVELRAAGNVAAVERDLFDRHDRVYASLIFERTKPLAEALQRQRPDAIIGGTGWSLTGKLEDVEIASDGPIDYSLYPRFQQSIGFTQRGCRLRCDFCVVPRKEGAIREALSIEQLWRGDPWPRWLILLDNDFFGQPRWRDRIDEIRSGGFLVNYNQGINARFLEDETAAAIASTSYRDAKMTTPRLYTAWDGRKDERRLFRGLDALLRYGVKRDHLMVYMLIGHEPGETHADRDYRRASLREWGARPYPMPFVRTKELLCFQRWVVGAYDKTIPWSEWKAARCNPRHLTRRGGQLRLPVVA